MSTTLAQLTRPVATEPEQPFVDMGYRRHICDGEYVVHLGKHCRVRIAKGTWQSKKRSSAIDRGPYT